jgi:hypothetical protein
MKKLLYDAEVKELVLKNVDMAIPHYLMSSYLYYKKDSNYISDGCFDWLSSYMYQNWLFIDHRHKYLIEKKKPNAGSSGYYITNYPSITKNAAKQLIKEGWKRQLGHMAPLESTRIH